MKVTCQACDASFLAPDEKIRGRVVKYNCRKCNTIIVADGTKLEAPPRAGEAVAAPTAAPAPVTPTPPPSGRTDVWGDTTEVSAPPSLSEPEPRREPVRPLVTHDSTAGWEPVPVAQAAAFKPAPRTAPAAAPSDAAPTRRIGFAAAASPTIKVRDSQGEEDKPTRKVVADENPDLDWDLGAGPKVSTAQVAASPAPPTRPAPQQPTRPQPAAAEAAKAPAGAAFSFPLFANDASPAQQKPLAATPSSDLVQEVSIESFDPVSGVPSGLNDLRALSSNGPDVPLKAPKSGTARVNFDELLSLNAPAVSSPMQAPSPLDWGNALGAPSPLWNEPAPAAPTPEVEAPAEEKKRETLRPTGTAKPAAAEQEPRKASGSNRGMFVAIAAGLIGITVGALGVKAMSGGDAPPSDQRLAVAESAAASQPAKGPTRDEIAQAAATETARVEAPTSTVAAVDPAAANNAVQGTSASGKNEKTSKAQQAEPSTNNVAPKAAADSKDSGSKTSAATTAPAATPTVVTPPPAAAAAPGTEFNKDAARAALSSAASSALACGKADGPKGVAKVNITFAPSGRVTTATINGPPFASTPTGGCIAGVFRRMTVPPFAGAAVSVNKTVQIQ